MGSLRRFFTGLDIFSGRVKCVEKDMLSDLISSAAFGRYCTAVSISYDYERYVFGSDGEIWAFK